VTIFSVKEKAPPYCSQKSCLNAPDFWFVSSIGKGIFFYIFTCRKHLKELKKEWKVKGK
jgi:hypothetical protein